MQQLSIDDGFDGLPDEAPILDPWVQKAAAPPPKRRLGIAAVVVVCLAQLAVLGAGVYGTMRYLSEVRQIDSHAKAEVVGPHDEVERKRDDGDPGGVVHAPLLAQPSPVGSSGSVPQETERRDVGSVKVVELGVKVSSLRQTLAAELAAAKASGKDVLVMTTRSGCEPCKGVEKSLEDLLMQQALGPVVLVKIDIDVFEKELSGLQMQHDSFPGFFLLGPDATPRDAIHGGEWGADIAENIAPVLGSFVRGQYAKRKNEWKKPMPHGVFL